MKNIRASNCYKESVD